MERQSTVQSVEVSHDGLVYSASYFIEHGVLRAKIGGRIYLSPLGNGPAADSVKAMLIGHLLQTARKADNARKWAAIGSGSAAAN